MQNYIMLTPSMHILFQELKQLLLFFCLQFQVENKLN
jgi:hypothetical protein